MSVDEHLNLYPYVPDGYVSPQDAAAQEYAYVDRNIYQKIMGYRDEVVYSDDPYRADESFDPENFQYIPTEPQVAAVLALENWNTARQGPTNQIQPGMQQLAQSLYEQAAQFWNEIRRSSGTGW